MRFVLPVLLSALVACSSDLEAQLDDLADELDELAAENAALSSEIDELAAKNAALSSEIDALSQVEADPAAPFVYFGRVYEYSAGVTTYTWTIHVDGPDVTRSEAVVHYWPTTTEGILGEASGVECLTMETTAIAALSVWVWQGDVLTCHSSYDERCFPIWGASSVDEC